eukprot:7134595-Pyramimonas_sp.AAC.1
MADTTGKAVPRRWPPFRNAGGCRAALPWIPLPRWRCSSPPAWRLSRSASVGDHHAADGRVGPVGAFPVVRGMVDLG